MAEDDLNFDFDDEFPFLFCDTDGELDFDFLDAGLQSTEADYVYCEYTSDCSSLQGSSNSVNSPTSEPASTKINNTEPTTSAAPVVHTHSSKKQKLTTTKDGKQTSTSSSTPFYSERQKYLLNAPKELQKAFNAGNFDLLTTIIKEAFDTNCTLQTSSMKKEINGLSNIIELFHTMSKSMPDIVLDLKKSRFNLRKRIITSIMDCSGTKQFEINNNDLNLFNIFVSEFEYGAEKVDLKLKSKVEGIILTGGHYRLHLKITWYFVLNHDMNKIKKFFALYKPLEVVESSSSLEVNTVNLLEPQVLVSEAPRRSTLPSAVPIPGHGIGAMMFPMSSSTYRPYAVGSNHTSAAVSSSLPYAIPPPLTAPLTATSLLLPTHQLAPTTTTATTASATTTTGAPPKPLQHPDSGRTDKSL